MVWFSECWCFVVLLTGGLWFDAFVLVAVLVCLWHCCFSCLLVSGDCV